LIELSNVDSKLEPEALCGYKLNKNVGRKVNICRDNVLFLKLKNGFAVHIKLPKLHESLVFAFQLLFCFVQHVHPFLFVSQRDFAAAVHRMLVRRTKRRRPNHDSLIARNFHFIAFTRHVVIKTNISPLHTHTAKWFTL
jgi:hypothetical protein